MHDSAPQGGRFNAKFLALGALEFKLPKIGQNAQNHWAQLHLSYQNRSMQQIVGCPDSGHIH